MAKVGNVIRDSEPPQPPPGAKKPYSLALSQAAWWFFLVIGSFVFIYLITGDYNTMTDQALILMGIGTGTALGSFMINATKRDTANTDLSTLVPQLDKLAAEVAALNPNADAVALAEKQAQLVDLNQKIADAQSGLSKPVSEGLRKDLLTDVNGIALHRFQMVIWTIVLGVIFLIGVYRDLAMPAFSGTLLALMGISAGTYLGFKIPERQN
jgi:outer membrane murein-binding lipoprotein Lpp